jgi:hypothetical protein
MSRPARIGVAFVVLGASVAGVLPPILYALRHRAKGGAAAAGRFTADLLASPLVWRVKAFTTGVMLSVSIVHVSADAWATLGQLEAAQDYPLYARYSISGPCVVLGILRCGARARGAGRRARAARGGAVPKRSKPRLRAMRRCAATRGSRARRVHARVRAACSFWSRSRWT